MRANNEIRLKKSSFVQTVEHNGMLLGWHSLFGNPLLLSASVLELISLFEQPRSLKSLYKEFEITAEQDSVLQLLLGSHFLIEDDFNERERLGSRLRQREPTVTSGGMVAYLGLIMSEACNFRCTYCIHFNNLETSDRIKNPTKFMTFEKAQEAVDGYLAILKKNGNADAEINFGGGEPLLAWPVIEQVLAYCTNQRGGEFSFKFSINTNAALITPEIAEALKENQVSVAVSLDGIGENNDRVRMKKSGAGTFGEITHGIDTLAAVGYPLDGVAVTVNEHNFEGLTEELIDWAHNRKMTEIRIDIDVIDMIAVPVDEIVRRLVRIRKYAKSLGIEVPGFWSRAFENLNSSTLETAVAFCGAVRGNSMCVSPSGNIYGCGYSTTQLGSLVQIGEFHEPKSRYHRFVRDHQTGTMEMCKGCMIEGQCAGGCNITREFARATHTAKIERMCDFYRAMTRELAIEQLAELVR